MEKMGCFQSVICRCIPSGCKGNVRNRGKQRGNE